jgi:hypothetical protein
MGVMVVRELDHDEIPRPMPVHAIDGAAMNQEATVVRLQGGINPGDVLEDLRSKVHGTEVGNGKGGHDWLLCSGPE